ncbi:mechanosensitive ion channel family protein [Kitasatospora sp. NPDC001664]
MTASGTLGLLADASPSPGPTADPLTNLPTSPAEAAEATKQATEWVGRSWQGWLEGGLRIVLIVLLALVLRAVLQKIITKFIARMVRPAEAEAETGRFSGLLANSGVVNTERRQQRSEAIGSVLRSVTSFTILGTAALMVLSALGVNLAPLLASAGVAGVAIGFGARNLVTDFLSGVFMILEDQYGVGDEIDTGVATGTVLEVGLRVTKLRGANGEIWYIRNGEVKRIANMSQGWATASVDVQVGYKEDLAKVEELIKETAERLSKESPFDELIWGQVKVLGLESVAFDSVTVRVEARTSPGNALLVSRTLRQRLKTALDGAGVKVKEETVTAAAAAAAAAAKSAESATAAAAAAGTAPSALADPTSPASLATKPIPAQGTE